MSDKLSEAFETIRTELGFEAMTVWSPSPSEDAEVEAIFFAKNESALMAAAVDYVTGDKAAS